MSKTMGKYETFLVVNANLGEEAVTAIREKFTTLIEANATIDSVEDWGKRRLAYPIEKVTEGYYSLVSFTSVPSFPAELDRIYGITDGVLRSLIVSKDN